MAETEKPRQGGKPAELHYGEASAERERAACHWGCLSFSPEARQAGKLSEGPAQALKRRRLERQSSGRARSKQRQYGEQLLRPPAQQGQRLPGALTALQAPLTGIPQEKRIATCIFLLVRPFSEGGTPFPQEEKIALFCPREEVEKKL